MKSNHGTWRRKKHAWIATCGLTVTTAVLGWTASGSTSTHDAAAARALRWDRSGKRESPVRADAQDRRGAALDPQGDRLVLEQGRKMLVESPAVPSGAFIEDSEVASLLDLGDGTLLVTGHRPGRSRIGIPLNGTTLWREFTITAERPWEAVSEPVEQRPPATAAGDGFVGPGGQRVRPLERFSVESGGGRRASRTVGDREGRGRVAPREPDSAPLTPDSGPDREASPASSGRQRMESHAPSGPHLGGIFSSGTGLVAVVDGRPVSAGDRVGSLVVETVDETCVILRRGPETIALVLDPPAGATSGSN